MKFTTVAVAFFAVIFGVKSQGLLSPLLGLGLNSLNLGLNPLGIAPVGLGINGLGLAVGGSNGLGLNHLAALWYLHNLGWGRRSGDLGVVDGGTYPYGYGNSLSQRSDILAVPTAAAGHNVNLGGYGAISGHGATYVAKTLGSVHTAPLDGHTNSVASVNVASAPGAL